MIPRANACYNFSNNNLAAKNQANQAIDINAESIEINAESNGPKGVPEWIVPSVVLL
jgi:hypothetical protein